MATRDDFGRREGRARAIGRRRAASAAGALACVLPLALGGCAGPRASVDPAPPEVESVEVDVRRALLESEDVGGAAIRVLVDEESGTVTLEGFVASEAERAEALRLAREALGGAAPVDALEVRD